MPLDQSSRNSPDARQGLEPVSAGHFFEWINHRERDQGNAPRNHNDDPPRGLLLEAVFHLSPRCAPAATIRSTAREIVRASR
jgi:hypothetical protein